MKRYYSLLYGFIADIALPIRAFQPTSEATLCPYMYARTNFMFLRTFCNNRLKFVNLRIGLAGTEATFDISEFLNIIIVSTG